MSKRTHNCTSRRVLPTALLPTRKTPSLPPAGLAARLRSMGIPCSADDIVSPAKLAADWLRAHDAGTQAGSMCTRGNGGIPWVLGTTSTMHNRETRNYGVG